ncbi:MAG: hypothetical protein K6F23_14965 [Solobacterium sp.]|nr:hypothetical protein [Solobacterium sp.]
MTELLKRINDELKRNYDEVVIGGRTLFDMKDGSFFKIDEFSDHGPFVIEYAEDLKAAEKGWLDDGEVFPRDMVFSQLISEIKECVANA